MKQFEYCSEVLPSFGLLHELNKWGSLGWQLVHLEYSTSTVYLMREVPPKHEENKQDALSKFTYEEMQEEMNRRYRSAIPFNKPNN